MEALAPKLLAAVVVLTGLARLPLGIRLGTSLWRHGGIKLTRSLAGLWLLLIGPVATLPWQFRGQKILPLADDGSLVTAVLLIGLALFALAAALHTWARYARGKTWVWAGVNPAKVDQHELITTGPYAFVRHPAYAAYIIGIMGLQLALNSWVFLLALPLACWCSYIARQEEHDLVSLYGEEYRSYQRKTWCLLPLVY